MSSLSNTSPFAERKSFGGIFKAALIGAGGAAAVNLVLLALAGVRGIPLNGSSRQTWLINGFGGLRRSSRVAFCGLSHGAQACAVAQTVGGHRPFS
jgi:hypothetical protein